MFLAMTNDRNNATPDGVGYFFVNMLARKI
jgi:hypothetical protein